MMRISVSCAHPSTAAVDPVLGTQDRPYAAHQRAPSGPCGPSGLLFSRETNVVKRTLRGRGFALLGIAYFGFFGNFIMRM